MAAMPSMSAASSAKSGDAFASSSFMGGDFIVGGGKFDLGSMFAQYWPVFVVGGLGVVWYMRKKR